MVCVGVGVEATLGVGVEALLMAVVLLQSCRHAGFEFASNYDGSWWEWSADLALPIEP